MKYNIRLWIFRNLISALAGGGIYGVLNELVPESLQYMSEGASTLVFICTSILCSMEISKLLKKDYPQMFQANWAERRRDYYRRFPNDDPNKLFENRMKTIMTIADLQMKKAHVGHRKNFRVRDTVLVEYDELLRMWKIAKLAKSETPVKT